MSNPAIGALLRELTLPKPHSVNAAFSQSYKKTAQYRTWRVEANASIMAQGPRVLLSGPVFIELIFPAEVCSEACDTDNQAKGCLDALVDMRILVDDNRMIVPVLLLRWGPGRLTIVRIYEYLGDTEWSTL